MTLTMTLDLVANVVQFMGLAELPARAATVLAA